MSDVIRIVEALPMNVKRSKLDKGYKFFFEKFIFGHEASLFLSVVLKMNEFREPDSCEEKRFC
ncbi:hypothetical protein ANANG_G00113180 [Anguilla anguilla]|uniref:Uncharacterized protein n=1 Tax=Anguilla anguilla TaxID=7936 RepID=A0A9D3MKL6_ANGAN|nr:hypothetical protein ANANG_G00113180 [Anguilla anguilla]